MNKARWIHSNTTVYNVSYHIIFCPKYRRKVLIDDIEQRLRFLLLEKAEELCFQIEKLEIMPDLMFIYSSRRSLQLRLIGLSNS